MTLCWFVAILFVCFYFFVFFYIDLGAAYGTAKSGVGIASMGVMNPQLIMKNMIPIIMAGVLGIYGLIISVILSGNSLVYLLFFVS